MNEDKTIKIVGIILISVVIAIIMYKFIEYEYYHFLLVDNMRKQNQIYTNMINITIQSKQLHKEIEDLILSFKENK